jgi:hypothetical protein
MSDGEPGRITDPAPVVRLEVCLLAEAAHAFLDSPDSKSLYFAELSAFREHVRAELVPNLADVTRTWRSNRSSDQHAGEHMKPLLESFSALKEEDDEPKEDRPARTSVKLIHRTIRLHRHRPEESSTILTSKTISDRRKLNLAASAGVLVFAGQSDTWRDAAMIFLPMPVQPKPV